MSRLWRKQCCQQTVVLSESFREVLKDTSNYANNGPLISDSKVDGFAN